MAYEPINWANGEEGGTPTSAANFNHMDAGISAAHDAAATAQSTADGKADPGDIPDVSNFITADDLPDAPDVSDFVTTSELSALESRIAALENNGG